MKNLIKTNVKKGFSLVELLVVIAVIGVIAAIAIPAMSGIFGKSEATKTKRNVQSIVSTFNAARAAGNASAPSDVAAAIDSVVTTTGLGGAGAFTGSTFAVPLGAAEVTAVKTAATITLSGLGANSILSVMAE